MAEQTNIEDLQATRHADSQQVNRLHAVRHLLGLLEARPDDARLGYPALLQRLYDVIALELAK